MHGPPCERTQLVSTRHGLQLLPEPSKARKNLGTANMSAECMDSNQTQVMLAPHVGALLPGVFTGEQSLAASIPSRNDFECLQQFLTQILRGLADTASKLFGSTGSLKESTKCRKPMKLAQVASILVKKKDTTPRCFLSSPLSQARQRSILLNPEPGASIDFRAQKTR